MRVDDDAILSYLKQAHPPVFGTRELACHFGYSARNMHKRLVRLYENGAVGRREIGGTDVWWHPERVK